MVYKIKSEINMEILADINIYIPNIVLKYLKYIIGIWEIKEFINNSR
jgi:hypothetical protein